MFKNSYSPQSSGQGSSVDAGCTSNSNGAGSPTQPLTIQKTLRAPENTVSGTRARGS